VRRKFICVNPRHLRLKQSSLSFHFLLARGFVFFIFASGISAQASSFIASPGKGSLWKNKHQRKTRNIIINMNLRLQNQLNMVGACINVAQSSDYKPVWNGKPPADFAIDIAQIQTDYGAITAKAAQAEAATGGAADAKSVAETTLEDAAFVLARALANHFKKTGDLDRLGKVDVSKSEIMKLRTQELVNRTTAIRDLGTAAVAEAGAAARGVTAARVAALTAFSNVMSSPRGQIVNRSALLREVETDTAALVDSVGDMDDLVLQFDGGEPGIRFKDAWRRARIIVDTGGGHASAVTPPTPPTPPA
jgi:hypothetical protein